MLFHPEADHDFDQDEFDKLKAEPWMVQPLRCNGPYPFWGPGQEYMTTKGDGWSTSLQIATWQDFTNGFTLNDYNELVNFYFEIRRNSKECKACFGSGYNPATKKLADTFYDLDNWSSNSERWCDAITQDEVVALQAEGRLNSQWNPNTKTWEGKFLSADEVNAANIQGNIFGRLNHDGINRYILIETRAKRLGVFGYCSTCDKKGYVYTEPAAHLSLTLWLLHPRKSASRGIDIERIEKEDLPAVKALLQEAKQRANERFSRIEVL